MRVNMLVILVCVSEYQKDTNAISGWFYKRKNEPEVDRQSQDEYITKILLEELLQIDEPLKKRSEELNVVGNEIDDNLLKKDTKSNFIIWENELSQSKMDKAKVIELPHIEEVPYEKRTDNLVDNLLRNIYVKYNITDLEDDYVEGDETNITKPAPESIAKREAEAEVQTSPETEMDYEGEENYFRKDEADTGEKLDYFEYDSDTKTPFDFHFGTTPEEN